MYRFLSKKREKMALGAIAGLGASTVGSVIQNESNYALAERNREENYRLNEQAADNAMHRGLALYNKTQSWGAQVKEMEEAGLSPGLVLGAGQTGGAASGAQGAGTSGQAPVRNENLLAHAELGLMHAQEEKLKAEARSISGGEERAAQSFSEILKGLGLDNQAKELDNHIKRYEGLKLKIESVNWEKLSGYALEEARYRVDGMVKSIEKQSQEVRALLFENDLNDEQRNQMITKFNNEVAITTMAKLEAQLQYSINKETKDAVIKMAQEGATAAELENKLKEWAITVQEYDNGYKRDSVEYDKWVEENGTGFQKGVNTAKKTIVNTIQEVGGLLKNLIPFSSR